MLNRIAAALKSRINDLPDIKQKEFYEGQLDRLDEYAINPPAVFIEFMNGTVSEAGEDTFGDVEVILHVLCGRLARTPDSLLSILTELRLELDGQPLLDEEADVDNGEDPYLGRMFIGESKRGESVPLLLRQEVSLTVKR